MCCFPSRMSRHLFSARGIPDNVCVMGAFCGFPREYLTPAHVCLLSRIYLGLLSTLLRDSPPPLLGAAQSTNSSEHSERSPCAADLHPSTSLLRSTVSRLACPDSRHRFSARGIPDNVCVMGAFRGFPREYLTPAHVCLLSRILFEYPFAPRTQPRRSRHQYHRHFFRK